MFTFYTVYSGYYVEENNSSNANIYIVPKIYTCNLFTKAGQSGDRFLVGARFFAPVQTGPGAHPASCTMGTESFPGVKSGRGVTLTPNTLLVPLVKKE